MVFAITTIGLAATVAGAAVRRDAAERASGVSVLRLLGQRELDPALGRGRPRDPDRAGALRRRRCTLHPVPRPRVPGSAVHPRGRPPSPGRLSREALARHAPDARDLGRRVPRRRPPGALRVGRPDVRPHRPSALRGRRGGRVPTPRPAGDSNDAASRSGLGVPRGDRGLRGRCSAVLAESAPAVSVVPDRHARLGQHGSPWPARGHLPRVVSGAVCRVACGCDPADARAPSGRRAATFHQRVERMG